MHNSQGDDYTCPSFSSYSSNLLAEIAIKVAAENSNDAAEAVDDGDFEFALVRDEDNDVSADELLRGGKIGPIFPVFNRNLISDQEEDSYQSRGEKRLIPLRELLIEEREVNNPPSCSSSEADELENIPDGTYCVWRPKAADQPSPTRCKKSKSTGSASRRWTFRDLLLRRSNSEGKNSFVFLTPKKREVKPLVEPPKKPTGKVTVNRGSGGGISGSHSAHEALYIHNRAIKEGDKKKSYLPYRQELVGFFVNLNGLDRSFPHF